MIGFVHCYSELSKSEFLRHSNFEVVCGLKMFELWTAVSGGTGKGLAGQASLVGGRKPQKNNNNSCCFSIDGEFKKTLGRVHHSLWFLKMTFS